MQAGDGLAGVKRLALSALALLLLSVAAAHAIGSPSGPPAELAAPGLGVPEASAPVPVPEPDAKTLAYYRGGNVLWVVGTLLGLAIPWLVLVTGLSARMRSEAERLRKRWTGVVALYVGMYTLLSWLVERPLAWYAGFVRPHAYGLSNQSLEKWLTDSLIDLGISTGLGITLALMVYAWIRNSSRHWWLGVTACLVPFLFVVFFVQPLWIAPLYNDFGPMQDPALEQKILALAERSGIEGGRVFEVAKSVDTKTVNAYVTGFLSSKRIVLWDTLLARLDEPEVLFVMGHEMGHYVLNHVVIGILVYTLMTGVGLFAIQLVAPWLIARYRERFGFDRLSDVASLPLLLLLLQLASLVAMPAALAFSRHMEHEADRFGLELVQDNRAAALAFVNLQQQNLSHPRPGPLFVWWRASHPTLGDRIDFANAYRPWQTGDPLRYADRFH